jgi:iron complex transport system substrate-binding protein
MKLRYIFFIIILVCFAVVFYAVLTNGAKSIPQNNACQRIVSLAPNITEIMFELGLGEKIVGTSEFSNYPPAAKQIPRVGALMNPNFEAIVALKPDLVILVDEMAIINHASNRLVLKRLSSSTIRSMKFLIRLT